MKLALRPKDEKSADLPSVDLLTERQREILNLIAIGHTNREIAITLKISVRTVEVHRFHLMRRLNVRNVAQLFRRALDLGLLSSRQLRSQSDNSGIGVVLQFPDRRKLRKAYAARGTNSIKQSKIHRA